MDRPESCPTCNRWTERGKQQMAVKSREKPIYGTDFSKPLSVLVEELRSDIAKIRGRMSDISYGYPAWREELDCVEGLLTCGLVTLYGTKEKMVDHEKLCAEEPAEALADVSRQTERGNAE